MRKAQLARAKHCARLAKCTGCAELAGDPKTQSELSLRLPLQSLVEASQHVRSVARDVDAGGPQNRPELRVLHGACQRDGWQLLDPAVLPGRACREHLLGHLSDGAHLRVVPRPLVGRRWEVLGLLPSCLRRAALIPLRRSRSCRRRIGRWSLVLQRLDVGLGVVEPADVDVVGLRRLHRVGLQVHKRLALRRQGPAQLERLDALVDLPLLPADLQHACLLIHARLVRLHDRVPWAIDQLTLLLLEPVRIAPLGTLLLLQAARVPLELHLLGLPLIALLPLRLGLPLDLPGRHGGFGLVHGGCAAPDVGSPPGPGRIRCRDECRDRRRRQGAAAVGGLERRPQRRARRRRRAQERRGRGGAGAARRREEEGDRHCTRVGG
mmetsp:Transcript_90814/g.293180  ORF Transcript_90814/g.293180 Transcript_90814/m.293180 type:complete len:380 (+) Transcript_90814:214-1353(+)